MVWISRLAGTAGVEPTMTVLETVVIPFNYAPIGLYRTYYTYKDQILQGI